MRKHGKHFMDEAILRHAREKPAVKTKFLEFTVNTID